MEKQEVVEDVGTVVSVASDAMRASMTSEGREAYDYFKAKETDAFKANEANGSFGSFGLGPNGGLVFSMGQGDHVEPHSGPRVVSTEVDTLFYAADQTVSTT